MKRDAIKAALLLSGGLAAFTTPAAAQQARETEMQEDRPGQIIVTARRTEETVSDVPISIAAYSQESLDEQGVRNVDDIANITPGVTLTRGDQRNAGAANIAIRGISSTAGSATTGIYIDDTPIQIRNIGFSAFTPFPAVFDLQRVEVLRGPQGTLFGAGSQGGTVRFITQQPDLNYVKGYGRTELAFTEGGDPSYEMGAAVSVPLVEGRLAARASGYFRRDGGYIDRVNYINGNMVDKNANHSDTAVIQAALAFEATENLTIRPSIFYQDIDIADGNYFWETLTDQSAGDFRNGNALANTSSDRLLLPAVAIELDLGDVSVFSNTSYFDRDQSAVNDYTVFEASLWAGNPFFPEGYYAPAFQNNQQKNFTQELRLQSNDPDSRLQWVIGAFYSRNKQVASQLVQNTFLPQLIQDNFGITVEQFFGQGLIDGKYSFVLDDARSTDEQIAGFGQVDFQITDRLALSAGLRVSKTDFDVRAQFVGPVVGPPVDDTGSQSETPVTPRFGITFEPDDDNLLYATAAKGFRIGGYNAAVGVPCGVSPGAPIPGTPLGNIGLSNRPELYDSDSVWSYEVGSKNSLFGNRLNIESSAFLIKWDNIQQSVALSCGFSFTDNLGSATSKGFDVAFNAAVTGGLTFGGQVGYVDANFDETVRSGPSAPLNLVTDGNAIALNPWQVSLYGQKEFNIADKEGYLRFDYRFQSKQTDATAGRDPRNGGADLTLPGRPELHLLSLRTGVKTDILDVSLFVNNVFNTHKTLFRQHDTQTSPLYRATTVRPRTAGITLTARY
ncbi:TonB-dependent receptor [Altericroceibacterium endophyticum]|uniref:TonB-dependent receptor n=1 Tax=Altericroceibacterium endophyticum TaxID=1808508 RepID=A0A6I4T7Q9_9SPHN|nr:TonB-dependent receptor [Altericroceibacterium endophyticum]MXO66728.1 TonB-dependent receptor [Altericroceibacterium endophyticum]